MRELDGTFFPFSFRWSISMQKRPILKFADDTRLKDLYERKNAVFIRVSSYFIFCQIPFYEPIFHIVSSTRNQVVQQWARGFESRRFRSVWRIPYVCREYAFYCWL